MTAGAQLWATPSFAYFMTSVPPLAQFGVEVGERLHRDARAVVDDEVEVVAA